MTRSVISLHASADDHRIAHLAALAIALTVAEAAIPSPIPGVKPGLANIVVLIVLARHGLRDAAWVSVLRVVGGSLVLGSFLSPGFWLSLAGAGASLAALWASCRLPARLFGPVSHSILAAFAHVTGQLALAYVWLIPHPGLIYVVPVLAAAALVFGVVNGVVAARILAEPGGQDANRAVAARSEA